jgi:hypothetical protein
MRLRQTSRLAIVATLTLASTSAHASGIEGCFREAQSFAMCNGFVAAVVGAGGTALPIVVLAEPDEHGAASIAFGVVAGIYAGVSGGALVAASQRQDPVVSTKRSGVVLGAVDLAVGGSALALSAIGGIAIALRSGPEEDPDDGPLEMGVRLGVPGALGSTAGLSFDARF